ncbi:MAG: hypothetical protein HXS44_04430 [Theionarchaea archaeon]|nr:hypothetical protein [Theionarchaea archaeon]
MKNVDGFVKLIQSEARDAFSMKADQEFCDLLDYAYEFRKEFMIKRRRAFS